MGTTSLATFLISLINHTFTSHVYSLKVHLITNAISLSPQCSASLTHALSLSLHCLPHFPLLSAWYKNPRQKLLFSRNCSNAHCCHFTQRFAHNNFWNSKDESDQNASEIFWKQWKQKMDRILFRLVSFMNEISRSARISQLPPEHLATNPKQMLSKASIHLVPMLQNFLRP